MQMHHVPHTFNIVIGWKLRIFPANSNINAADINAESFGYFVEIRCQKPCRDAMKMSMYSDRDIA